MPKIEFRSWYYAFSAALMALFPWICRLCADGNLPPQKPFARFWINLIFLNLLLAYGLFFYGKNKNKAVSKAEWGLFILVGLFLCALPPVFSGDLHEYLMRGRILGVYHENPYLVPREYPEDPFYKLTYWVAVCKLPENYGPLWTGIQSIAPAVFRHSYFASVFFFKFILFLFFGGSVWMLGRIAKFISPEHARWMVPIFALNPNLIDHILIDGHNDIVMVFWLLTALYLLLSDRYYWAVAAGTLAVLIKFTCVIFLPVIGIYYFRSGSRQTVGRFIGIFLRSSALFFGVALLFYTPFWVGPGTLSYFSKFSEWFASNSVPFAVHRLLGRLGIAVSEAAMTRGFMIFFAVNCVLALAWLWFKKEKDVRVLCRAMAWMFVAMYISYTIPFYGHHLLWMLPFLILADLPAPLLCFILYSATGIFFYFKRMSVLFIASLGVYFSYLLCLSLGAKRALKESGTDRGNRL